MKNLYSLFFRPGEVVELRAIGIRGKNPAWEGFASGKGGIVSGYFNDPEKLANAAEILDGAGARGVYFTINPCKEPLLSRAANRLVCPENENATSDQHILYLRWFLVDLDSFLLDGTRRPKGISASDEELASCKEKAEEVAAWLESERGFSRALRCFSGNGFHLNYRLPDLPNDDHHRNLIKKAMATLAGKFGDVVVDVSVVNPARIWKYYSTMGRKGDNTKERPHRRSYVFANQPEQLDDLPVTDIAILSSMAALAPSQALISPAPGPGSKYEAPTQSSQYAQDKKEKSTRIMLNNELGPVDMEKYLNYYGVKFNIKDDGSKTLYRLERCLFNNDHGANEASIVVPRQGAIHYQCFHASCKYHTWKEARRIISGDKSIAEFCDGYDRNWTPPTTTGTGLFSEDVVIDFIPNEEAKNAVYGPNGDLIPPPSKVDWREFYIKGRRDEFVPLYLVRYLQRYLYPLSYTARQFWKYENGLWKSYSDSLIRKHITRALKEKIQGRTTDNVMKILADEAYTSEELWDQTPLLINCRSGMIDIETGETITHSPKYLSRVQLPVCYDPRRESIKWFEFLKDIFPEDFVNPKDSRTYMIKYYLLQQWFGYCLLRDNRFHKALFLYGSGSNGKSTIIETLQAMVGEANTSNLSLSDLCQRFKIQHLVGKMVNLATETGSRDPLAMDVFKTIIAGEKISAERKFGDVFDFRPYAKFCVSMNDTPVISDKSFGFERRLIVLSFNRRIEKNEIIPNMKERIIEEIDGIFTWAVRGLQDLLKRNGFYIGDTIGDDTAQFMKTVNPLLIFGEECCQFGPDYETDPQALWDKYKSWCEDGKNRPLGRNNFYNQILAQYPHVKRDRTELRRLIRGIRLKPF